MKVISLHDALPIFAVCNNQLPYRWLEQEVRRANKSTNTVETTTGGCYTVRTLTLTVNALKTSTQTIAVCNNQLPYTWLGHVFNAAGSLTDTVASTTGGCDTVRTLTLTVNALKTSTQTIAVSNNQLTYTLLAHVFNAAGSLTDTVASTTGGFDTVRTLTLTVNTLNLHDALTILCNNQLPYTWLGHVFNAAGSLTDTVASTTGGCDTVRTLTLTVNALKTSTQTIAVCNNQLPYTWLGHVFAGANTITDTVASTTGGCDTVRTLTLTVNALKTSTQTIAVCNNQLPYTWLGHVFNAADTLTDTVASTTGGCDTVRTLTLTVNELKTSTQNIAVCNNQLPYTWLGHVFNAAGSLTDTVASTTGGCDTVRTLTLTVNALKTSTQTIAVCNNQLPYTWLGHVFNAAGSLTDTVASTTGGCDTVRTLTLRVNAQKSSTQTITECNNQLPYTLLGHVFNAAHSITDTVASKTDSCYLHNTLPISVNALKTSTQTIAVCNNQLPYTWLGHVFNAAGSLTDTVSSTTGGCDTLRTLTLTVNTLLTSTQTKAVCTNQLPYIWYGHVFNAADTITDTVTSTTGGCATSRTLTLTVNTILTSKQTKAICTNHTTYLWYDHVFNAADSITDTVASTTGGCDTLRTLTLTVSTLLTSTQTKAICTNQLPYIWYGHVFNA